MQAAGGVTTPPFDVPVFVVTHHARPSETKGGTRITFVTDGIEAAVAEARTAAGEQDVTIVGGAAVVQEGLRAGLVDELRLHVVPVLLGDGVRLFDGVDGAPAADPGGRLAERDAPDLPVRLAGAVSSESAARSRRTPPPRGRGSATRSGRGAGD